MDNTQKKKIVPTPEQIAAVKAKVIRFLKLDKLKESMLVPKPKKDNKE